MKIKLIEPGYETYTGFFGIVEFENGVSTHDVSSIEASLLSSILQVEDADTGEKVGQNELERQNWGRAAESTRLPTQAEIDAENGAGSIDMETLGAVAQAIVNLITPEKKTYTREELEAIADKRGIAGIREVADQFDIKGTSIVKLIDAIMAAQAPAEVTEKAKEVEFVEPTDEVPAAE